MNILKGIIKAIQGSVNEVGETIVNKQSIRILEQTLRDAEKYLDKGEEALTAVMADRKEADRELTVISDKLNEYGHLIEKCFEKNEPELARQIAEKMAELEQELKSRHSQMEKLAIADDMLNIQRKKSTAKINDIKRQVSLLKAQDSINNALQLATNAIGSHHPDYGNLNDMVIRITNNQQRNLDKISAAEKLQEDINGGNLNDKLMAAGILKAKISADEILNRYKDAHTGD
jgi:phage shock protein A